MNKSSIRSTILALFVVSMSPDALAASEVVTVYKSPYCGCCAKWVDHLRENGFRVQTVDTQALAGLKSSVGVPAELASCHTAMVEGYIIEGHVPAQDIRRLLEERPTVKGLTVPGMPHGSPGMEGPAPEHYQVLTIDAGGKTTVFAEH